MTEDLTPVPNVKSEGVVNGLNGMNGVNGYAPAADDMHVDTPTPGATSSVRQSPMESVHSASTRPFDANGSPNDQEPPAKRVRKFSDADKASTHVSILRKIRKALSDLSAQISRRHLPVLLSYLRLRMSIQL